MTLIVTVADAVTAVLTDATAVMTLTVTDTLTAVTHILTAVMTVTDTVTLTLTAVTVGELVGP